MGEPLPADVIDLLERAIGSVRQLDLLLVMRAGGQPRAWSAAELEAKLRSSPTAVDTDLAGLLQMELVEVEVGPPALWTYAGGDADRTVERLEACYRTHRTSVIRTIARSHDRSLDKFADAFRFRRREDRDG